MLAIEDYTQCSWFLKTPDTKNNSQSLYFYNIRVLSMKGREYKRLTNNKFIQKKIRELGNA
jgi:hypothetical protein